MSRNINHDRRKTIPRAKKQLDKSLLTPIVKRVKIPNSYKRSEKTIISKKDISLSATSDGNSKIQEAIRAAKDLI